MTTFHTLLLVGHVLIALMIIGLVMLQRGKGADAGAGFGAGASGTVFGAKGSANFLSRSTAVLATLFFISSMSLAYLGGQRKPVESLLDQAGTAEPDTMQLAPAAGAEETDLDGLPGLEPPEASPAPQPEAPASDSGTTTGQDAEGADR